ncbi:NnrS family protein [Futiania mangrovi]|uniref:NnrS family protein n=1 Tax=Futiania mangrovi TaxID=2959716 RepID=A0A9J6PJ45_9PROT|nr:NnrS family protein [Futiania mangrovii]MCP1337832.1 NnrS family protein [Futiania mangrovii]
MATSAERMRAWQGPALLSFGFRPFFLGAGLWAVLVMLVWLPMLGGDMSMPTAFDPVSWHAHEFLFGYLGAAVAGFLLTAVPNWTGRLPIVGWPLGALFAVWICGRVAIATSEWWPFWLVALAELAFPVLLALALAREIAAGKNWRNLTVLAALGVLTLGNGVFLWEAARGDYAAGGAGLRIGLAAALMMIALIGGRIVPSFTRNWLARRDAGRLPSPVGAFDRAVLAATGVALAAWVAAPDEAATGIALIVAGVLNVARLARWCGHRTGAEPLLWVLHVGYAFLPLGALAVGAEVLWPGLLGMAAAQHLWMAGAIGVMTLAVMTRATLGHTGRSLTAGQGTTILFVLIVAATLLRIAAGAAPDHASLLHMLAGLAWLGAFGGFVLLYGPLLLRPRGGR